MSRHGGELEESWRRGTSARVGGEKEGGRAGEAGGRRKGGGRGRLSVVRCDDPDRGGAELLGEAVEQAAHEAEGELRLELIVPRVVLLSQG